MSSSSVGWNRNPGASDFPLSRPMESRSSGLPSLGFAEERETENRREREGLEEDGDGGACGGLL